MRPTPPGQLPGRVPASILANTDSLPAGLTCTIVVPVPWLLFLSLKLLMSRSPARSFPALAGTTTIPYGLMSPFAGTVAATVETLVSGVRKATAVVAGVVDEDAAADALELEAEPELLLLPQAASTRASPATARAWTRRWGIKGCLLCEVVDRDATCSLGSVAVIPAGRPPACGAYCSR